MCVCVCVCVCVFVCMYVYLCMYTHKPFPIQITWIRITFHGMNSYFKSESRLPLLQHFDL